MVSQTDIDSLIMQKFVNEWSNGVPYYFDNDAKSLPSTEYVRMLILEGAGSNISTGNSATQGLGKTEANVRQFGALIAEIRCEKGTGKGRSTELAKDFTDIFENTILGALHLFESTASPTETDTHYGKNVLIGWWWDK